MKEATIFSYAVITVVKAAINTAMKNNDPSNQPHFIWLNTADIDTIIRSGPFAGSIP